MNGVPLLALELVLVAAVMGWALRELWLLRRDKRQARQQDEARARGEPPASDASGPAGDR